MATAHAVRGPFSLILSSAAGQWAVLGLGGAALMWPEQFMEAIQPTIRRLVAASRSGEQIVTKAAQQAPIIIHTGDGRSSKSNSLVATLTMYGLGAGCVWLSYTVCATCLPEYMKEMFPVTRRFFDEVTTKLSDGIYQVKEVLGKQILLLSRKQDDLGKKQDKANEDISDIKGDLGEARDDIRNMGDSLDPG